MTDEPLDIGFIYKARKSGDVEILHRGKLATTLCGRDATDFVVKVERVTANQAQVLMARLPAITNTVMNGWPRRS